jgi:F0F1-type ATP synthase membrane subunit c/vacuolar-type H+-ATPase subunit K
MRKHFNKKNFKIVLYAALMFAGFMFVLSSVRGGANAQNVTQGYGFDETMQNGTIVQLKAEDEAKVEPLPQEEEEKMLGVVVSSSESPVSLSSPDKQQVFIATQGRYDVLVSDQNGQISVGDGIVISSIEGVGMKADELHRVLVGRALENFDGESDFESKAQISDGRAVSLGRIRVDISVNRNPAYTGDTIAGVPRTLSRIAHAVTDKPVTAFRIYAGLAVMLVCMGVAGAILYSGIRHGMNSIGRNPLAKGAVIRNMITTTIMALIVVSIGLFAVYLLLKI